MPNGTEWGILFNGTPFLNGSTFRFNGTFVYTAAPRLSFEVVNGTYPFRVTCLCGPPGVQFWNTTATSPLSVEGVSVTVQATFLGEQISLCGNPSGCAQPEPPYPITFAASGLLGGTLWGLNFDDATVFSNGTNLSYFMWNGTYRYRVEAPGWQPSPANGNVVVNGTGLNQSVTFTSVTYPVAFQETGLKKGSNWSIQLNGLNETSNASTLVFDEPNGTYTWTLLGTPSSPLDYWWFPGDGHVVVNGSSAWITVAFVPVLTFSCPLGGCGPITYPFGWVEFVESGLPNGAEWSATINGTTMLSTVRTLVVFEESGNYTYALEAPDAVTIQGSVGVSETPMTWAVPIPVHFVQPHSPSYYQVTFFPTVNGAFSTSQTYPWQVAIYNATALSFGLPVTVWEPNGSYKWSVVSGLSPLAGGILPPQSGSAIVDGESAVVPISTLVLTRTHTLTFSESGLPSGMTWSVTLDSTVYGSAASTISFAEPNGTYSFQIGAVAGFTANPSNGSVAVAGSNQTVTIAFASTSGGGGSSSVGFLGLQGDTGYYLVGAIVAVVVIGLGVVLILRARRK